MRSASRMAPSGAERSREPCIKVKLEATDLPVPERKGVCFVVGRGVGRLLQLDDDHADGASTHVLQRVWGKRLRPEHERPLQRELDRARVNYYIPIAITTNEVCETQEVLDAGPPMGVEGHRVAGLDLCLDDPHPLVLQEHNMVCRGSGDSIKSVRPLPLIRAPRHDLSIRYATIIPRRVAVRMRAVRESPERLRPFRGGEVQPHPHAAMSSRDGTPACPSKRECRLSRRAPP